MQARVRARGKQRADDLDAAVKNRIDERRREGRRRGQAGGGEQQRRGQRRQEHVADKAAAGAAPRAAAAAGYCGRAVWRDFYWRGSVRTQWRLMMESHTCRVFAACP